MAATSDSHLAGGSVDRRACLAQQLTGDHMFGIDSVPIPRGALADCGPARSAPPAADQSKTRVGTSDASGRLRLLDEREVKSCRKCSLSESRTQTVFGAGSPDARLVFVGEAPGFHEDRQGIPFVGDAGDLLTKMIQDGMGLAREEVFICNVLKCRPPGNRDPAADEILACSSYLQRQLEYIQPEVIVALGAPAAKTLLHAKDGIGKLRGRFHKYFLSGVTGQGPSVPLMPTYHPSYLLRSPGEKGKSWSDLQMVMARLGLPIRKS